jgi:hypothetical protein
MSAGSIDELPARFQRRTRGERGRRSADSMDEGLARCRREVRVPAPVDRPWIRWIGRGIRRFHVLRIVGGMNRTARPPMRTGRKRPGRTPAGEGGRPARAIASRVPAYRQTRRRSLRRMGKKPPRSFIARVRITDLKIHPRSGMEEGGSGSLDARTLVREASARSFIHQPTSHEHFPPRESPGSTDRRPSIDRRILRPVRARGRRSRARRERRPTSLRPRRRERGSGRSSARACP